MSRPWSGSEKLQKLNPALAVRMVFGELGHGFSELVYQRALVVALRDANLVAKQNASLTVSFRGTVVGTFIPDLVVAGVVIVEVKAAGALESYASAQLLNYLKAAGGGVGLLVNFGHRFEHKRLVMGDPKADLPNLCR